LANDFSSKLNIKIEYCLAALNELQNHAIDKLQANKELKEEGNLTILLKSHITMTFNFISRVGYTKNQSSLQKVIGRNETPHSQDKIN
jgi:hypothetical protein